MMKFFTIFSSILFTLALPLHGALAHGGDNGGADKCSQSVGNDYNMHMTSYIPDDYGGREFCDNIPDTGRVIVVFDMLEVHLRHHETDVRIIKDTGTDIDTNSVQYIQANTIFHQPFSKIKTGSLYFDHTYQYKGKYIGIVSVRDHGKTHVTKFPYSVGYGAQQKVTKNYGLTAALLIALLASAAWWRLKTAHRKTDHPSPA